MYMARLYSSTRSLNILWRLRPHSLPLRPTSSSYSSLQTPWHVLRSLSSTLHSPFCLSLSLPPLLFHYARRARASFTLIIRLSWEGRARERERGENDNEDENDNSTQEKTQWFASWNRDTTSRKDIDGTCCCKNSFPFDQ